MGYLDQSASDRSSTSRGRLTTHELTKLFDFEAEERKRQRQRQCGTAAADKGAVLRCVCVSVHCCAVFCRAVPDRAVLFCAMACCAAVSVATAVQDSVVRCRAVREGC